MTLDDLESWLIGGIHNLNKFHYEQHEIYSDYESGDEHLLVKSVYSSDCKPINMILDIILEEFYPTITVLQYNKLIREIVTETYNKNEFILTIDITDLYYYLKSWSRYV